jgi:hypothetical protein
MSEFERADRLARDPTMEDLHQLKGASTPHFALHLRNRIRNLIEPLASDHPIRVEGEREIRRLDRIAVEGEHRGTPREGLAEMPSLRRE